jgi:GNAT superfamily N-acetyltransferase
MGKCCHEIKKQAAVQPTYKLSNMKLFEATFDDIPELSNLLTLLFTQEADFEPDGDKQAEGLRQIIGQPDIGRILILRDQSMLLGMVTLLFTVSTALGSRVAILEDMIVRPDARQSGIGSSLLQYAIGFAKSNGCARITLLTDRTNSGAIRFYQKHGFKHSEMIPLRLLIV